MLFAPSPEFMFKVQAELVSVKLLLNIDGLKFNILNHVIASCFEFRHQRFEYD